MRTLFLTGGGGFIGSHLCARLVGENRIVVYDNGSRDALRHTRLLEHPNLTYVKGDILDKALLAKSAEGADVIIHLAAVAGVSNYYERPVETMRTNLLGTSNVLDVARELKPRLFVNFSSSEVYGPATSGARETDTTTQGEVKVSRWTYAVSKLAGEHLCFAFHREYGLPVTSVRPFNVYGPRQVGEGAVPIFAALALGHEPIVVHNDGSQLRAWLYVDDFVEGFVRVLESPKSVGETFNLGNPIETVSVLTLAQKIVRLCSSRSEVRFTPYRPEGDVRVRIPSIDRAESLLGWKPGVSLDDGLARTVAWHRDVLGPR